MNVLQGKDAQVNGLKASLSGVAGRGLQVLPRMGHRDDLCETLQQRHEPLGEEVVRVTRYPQVLATQSTLI